VVDTEMATHVATNSDLALAEAMVDYIVWDVDYEGCE
jgi:hypothetical protein